MKPKRTKAREFRKMKLKREGMETAGFRLRSTGGLKPALFFIAGIAVFFIAFSAIISSINLYSLKVFAASSASSILSLLGVQNGLQFLTEPTITVAGVDAQITNLCAGDVEIALLFAIILATWDRSIRKRIFGCIFGFLAVLILNPLRIAAVLAAGSYFGWNAADAIHGILFRAVLLLIIVGYYFLWYVKYDDIAVKFTFLTEKSKKRYKKR